MTMGSSFALKSDSIVDEIMIPLLRTRARRLGLRSSESEGRLAVALTLASLPLSFLPFFPLSREGG